MTETPRSEQDHLEAAREALAEAAAPHAAFDGWSNATFEAAVADSNVDPQLARVAAPRRGVDLAVAFHRLGDRRMERKLAEEDLSALRFRDRVSRAVRLRLEVVAADREAVRRSAALFALPTYAAEGARLVWGTADAIWMALGDASEDYNWYSKRAILSGVYSSTALYWLGDNSQGARATWAFLDRRIDGVMSFESVKSRLRGNRLARGLLWGPRKALGMVRAPGAVRTGLPVGLPGRRR